MKNEHLWKPGRFIPIGNRLIASRDRREVGVGSRFIGDIQAEVYARAIREHAKGSLLDIGCGRAPLYGLYKQYVNNIVCIDWADSPHDNLHLDYEFDINREIPLADNAFDTILATDVLEHLSNPDCFWRETARLLTVGGKIILGVPFLYHLHETPYDYARYSEYRLALFCRQNGLHILYLEPYGGSLEVLCDIIAKHVRFSMILSSVHLKASKALVRSFVGKFIFKKTAGQFPLGYCLVAKKTDSLL